MDDEVVSIGQAAAEAGVSLAEYITQLVDSGMLLEVPDSLDPRCEQARQFTDMPTHVDDCGCAFIAAPHPDIRPL